MAHFPVILIPLLCFVTSLLAECPRYQVPHTVDGTTICCKPVFNCQMDHEIHFCDEDGGKDMCTPCAGESINKYVTSSLDAVHHRCFNMTVSHMDCPIQTTYPVLDTISCDFMYCRCKEEECRYGNVCHMCKQRIEPCGENEEMNETGDCVSCKALMSSPPGCGSCQYNETLWRLQQDQLDNTHDSTGDMSSNKVTKKVSTVEGGAQGGRSGYIIATDTPKNKTNEAEQGKGKEEGGGVSPVVVIIIIVVLLLCALAVALVLYIKKKIQNGDKTSELVVCYMYLKMCRRSGNNYRGGQQDPEIQDTNGDVPHRAETELKVQQVKPFIRQTEEVTENGACGGDEDEGCAVMQRLKDHEETSQKEK